MSMDCAALREAVETWPELDRLRQLRAAVALWPASVHEQWCPADMILFGEDRDGGCRCGHDKTMLARATARRLVGLENEE